MTDQEQPAAAPETEPVEFEATAEPAIPSTADEAVDAVVVWLADFCRPLKPEITHGREVSAAVGVMLANLAAATDDDFTAPQLAAASELLVALASDEAADIVRQSVEHQLANRLGAHPFAECPSSRFRLQPAQFARVVGAIADLIASWR